MAKELVTDQLWETIEPLLPPEPPKPQGGRPRIEDRAALTGIVFLLNRLGEAEQIDGERASLDSASIPAKRGAQKPQRIRRIRERRARSVTLFRTEEAS